MYEHCCVSAGADVWIHWRIKPFFRRVPLPSSFLIHWLTLIDWTIVLFKFNNFLILTTRWLELAYEKSIFSLPPSSVADPYRYHFDTDLDPGCEKIRYGFGSRANFDTDPDPRRTSIRIRIQAKTIRIRIQRRRTKYQENLKKVMKNAHNPCFVGVYLSIINHLNFKLG